MGELERAIHAFCMEFEPGHPAKDLEKKATKHQPDGSVLTYYETNGGEYEVRKTRGWVHVRNTTDPVGRTFSFLTAGLPFGV